MKTEMEVGKEIVVTASDEIGVLSRISTIIAETHANIRAVCAYELDDTAHLRIVTDDNQKALAALHKAGFNATEHEVVLCGVSPHLVHPDASGIAGNFEVENNYWCASAHSGEHALLVFSPADNVHLSSSIR
ncbi:MAG: hypothetical protein A3I09_01710 [Deltaproteobacteria bacterium RIFCSPLOWO2_02_FULL_47_10]|nr:MAG: hypothetical protein A3I09_01710 [Deltaproteobacteria bacterium RIFCSPLOWO2_02_FULL_47_10]